jgi:DNA-directed RNA polymerase specialized sigma24 family protein
MTLPGSASSGGGTNAVVRRKEAAPPRGVMTIPLLERTLRNYWELKSIAEERDEDHVGGADQEFVLENGVTVNLIDLRAAIDELPQQQSRAVILTCLYHESEREAAVLMGLKSGSSIGHYKQWGLAALVKQLWPEGLEESGIAPDRVE